MSNFSQFVRRAILQPRASVRHYSQSIVKNEDVHRRFPLVILVDEHGTRQPDPIPPSKILATMDRRCYDLILVNAQHVPPLVRLRSRSADYLRERAQEEAAALQRLRTREKEVRFGTAMAAADRERRVAKVKELLMGAYRVRVVVEGDVMGRERFGGELLTLLKQDYSKDLHLLTPPEVGAGAWAVTVQSASAKPALLRHRQERDKQEQ